ncbi:ionotropic receptor 21a-like [Teleopsis dalmanni]|uniref:ionotropic receptor 21a-like n=1 Tax=Teleopsis dalmanni TaxID=139649 RepID=UPI0018CFA3DB|nr:ionotropic receptor 21a-like [Teleopsis dalmanni]
MYGCDMVVTANVFNPLIIIDKNYKPPQKLDRLDGIEGMILTLISQKLNFTFCALPKSITDIDHVPLSGNITEAMKMIIEGTSNIAIGGYMYNKMHSSIMQATFPYLSSSVYVIIPKGRQMSPYERLVKPFGNIIWICLGFSVLFAIFIIFGVKLFCKIEVLNFIFGQKNRLPFTNLWSSLYGVGLHRLPRRNFARYLLTVWILYTLVLRNAYLSELFSILQDGRTRTSLQTVDELIEKNYTFYVHYTIEDMMKESTKSTNIQTVENYTKMKYIMVSRTRDEAETIAIPTYEYILFYYNQNKSHDPYYFLPEKLLTVPLTMYLPKYSFLLHKINEILMDIMSSGFIRKFEDTYLDKNRLLQKESHIAQALSVWLLFGIFSLYLILLLLCVFVFFLELCSRRSTFLKSILDFFNA